jgi:D-amino-acid oxidase
MGSPVLSVAVWLIADQELPSRVYFADDEIDVAIQVWWKDIVRNVKHFAFSSLQSLILQQFRPLPSEDVPSKYKSGVAFSTVSLVPKLYLPWLKQELEAGGVQFLRKYVASVDEAAAFCGPNGVIINATGLGMFLKSFLPVILRLSSSGARSLLGAEDLDVIPIKGQGILVDCPGLKNFYGVEDS